jgi:hypothetical protein
MDNERVSEEVETARARFEKALTGGDEGFMVLMTVMGAVMIENVLAVTRDAAIAELFLNNLHEQIRRWEFQNSTALPKC